MSTTAVTPARLTARHFRYQFLETVRVPIAVVGTTLFPALSLLFFVVPQGDLAADPVLATQAVAQLAVFAVMSVCLFTYGAGVAEDRALPWDGYLRTLPAGPAPRLGGRLLNGIAFTGLGLLPLLAIAAVLTEATLPWSRVVPSALALLAASLPFLGLGMAIGYSLTAKAAIAVAQLLLLPLAFAGGLFLPPFLFPDWLDALSQWTPSRAGRDLVVGATTGEDVGLLSVVVLVTWTLVAGVLAVVAYRRDEGRRFR